LDADKTSELISRIQSGFPITDRPFKTMAENMGSTEGEIIRTLKSLIRDHTIREFGPVFDPVKLGYTSTLVAARIDPERVAELSASLLEINEITHNYYRDGKFNLWFTITARTSSIIESIIRRVVKFPGVTHVIDLPAIKIYKISTVFGAGSAPATLDNGHSNVIIPETEKNVIKSIQNGFPIVERPFNAFAEELGMEVSYIFELLNRWIDNGTIRRFGARVNHRQIGYTFNVLAAWDGQSIEKWGEEFAGMKEVSHCYERKSYPEWPYRLYTMIHAKNSNDMQETLKAMRSIAFGSNMVTLKTLYELKKVSMKYFLENDPWETPQKE
jgi:siroheme decarboxylase